MWTRPMKPRPMTPTPMGWSVGGGGRSWLPILQQRARVDDILDSRVVGFALDHHWAAEAEALDHAEEAGPADGALADGDFRAPLARACRGQGIFDVDLHHVRGEGPQGCFGIAHA